MSPSANEVFPHTPRGTKWDGAHQAWRRFRQDGARLVEMARDNGARMPRLTAARDSSLWALGLLRASSALRATVGSSLGLSEILRTVFHIDVWSDDIGGGLRLPHPFGIVIGDGVSVGEGCTVLHGVTLQRGCTTIGKGVVLANGVTVLAGSCVGAESLVGAHSVVRGELPANTVSVGTPAKAIRPRVAAEHVATAHVATAHVATEQAS